MTLTGKIACISFTLMDNVVYNSATSRFVCDVLFWFPFLCNGYYSDSCKHYKQEFNNLQVMRLSTASMVTSISLSQYLKYMYFSALACLLFLQLFQLSDETINKCECFLNTFGLCLGHWMFILSGRWSIKW